MQGKKINKYGNRKIQEEAETQEETETNIKEINIYMYIYAGKHRNLPDLFTF